MPAGAPDPEREPPLRRGDQVGRFVVLGVEGVGGMGWVFSAYDPDLDRKVALKLLRPRRHGGERSAASRRRLLREAQALARLSHPNVITVYDVGEVDGRVFLAMELVAGRTLASWLAGRTPPRRRRERRAVLGVFAEAGRGLAAAHAAGLVHRDLKPANVMVADDGRVVVVDFGLARQDEGDDGDVVPLEELDRPAAALAGRASGGAAAGTPAYMAPEQRAARPATAASDQYSFCVALWEALHGEPPPGGDSVPAGGSLPAGGGDPARLPARLRRLLRRGLDPDPARRHPSMESLVAELEAGRAPVRRPWLVAALTVALATGGAVGYQRAADRRAQLCRVPEARLSQVWGGERRDAARSAFAATGLAYAGDAFAAADRTLAGYLDRWGAMHADSCAATHLRGEQSESLLDLRTACLDQRLAEADALARLFAAADGEVVKRAGKAATELTPLSACADTAALTAPLAPPGDEKARAAVAAVREKLAEAAALIRVGRYDPALTIADPALADARSLGYFPLIAEAAFERGEALERQAQTAAARKALEDALLAAEAGRHDQVAVEAFIRLVRLTSEQEADHERALDYAAHAEALLGQLGDHPDLEARLGDFVGEVYRRRGEPDRAEEQYRRSLERLEAAYGREHPAVANTLTRLGVAQLDRGELEAALATEREALAIYERTLGREHPDVGSLHDDLGAVLYRLGDYSGAAEHHRRALEIARAAYGAAHPAVAGALTNLGNVYLAEGDLTRAEESYREALAAFEQSLGPRHPNVALALSNLGATQLEGGHAALAAETFRRALAIKEEVYGRDHPAVASTVFNVGEALRQAGEPAAAAASCRRALKIWESSLPAGHYALAYALTCLGESLTALGEPARALPPLRRALELRSAEKGDPGLLAETRFALARTLLASGGSRDEAHRLATAARDGYARAGAAGHRKQADVEAWLAAHFAAAAGRPDPEEGPS